MNQTENSKAAETSVGIMDVIRKRWSPRSFTDQPVPADVLERAFEAARWAPSSYNEQPWRFFLGLRNEGPEWEKILSCLNPWNQEWAKLAPVLILIAGKKTFSRNGNQNHVFTYDLGQAAACFSLQLTADGFFAHQMAGLDINKSNQTFEVPEDYTILTAMAVGAIGAPEQLDEEYLQDELAPRTRKPLSSLVFGEKFGECTGFLEK